MTRKTDLIVPFSFKWHEDADLDGHCEMPYNDDGFGPELDPHKVAYIQCWCWRGEDCTVIPPREIGPDLSDCPYYQYSLGGPVGKCNHGCWEEPICLDEDWL